MSKLQLAKKFWCRLQSGHVYNSVRPNLNKISNVRKVDILPEGYKIKETTYPALSEVKNVNPTSISVTEFPGFVTRESQWRTPYPICIPMRGLLKDKDIELSTLHTFLDRQSFQDLYEDAVNSIKRWIYKRGKKPDNIYYWPLQRFQRKKSVY